MAASLGLHLLAAPEGVKWPSSDSTQARCRTPTSRGLQVGQSVRPSTVTAPSRCAPSGGPKCSVIQAAAAKAASVLAAGCPGVSNHVDTSLKRLEDACFSLNERRIAASAENGAPPLRRAAPVPGGCRRARYGRHWRRTTHFLLHTAAQSWLFIYNVTFDHAGNFSNELMLQLEHVLPAGMHAVQYCEPMLAHASRASAVIHVSCPFQNFVKQWRKFIPRVSGPQRSR